MVPNVTMHAINAKKNFWNDEAMDVMIGCKYGSINASVDDIPPESLVQLRKRLSQAMDKAMVLPVPENAYPLNDPEITKNMTAGMLEDSERVMCVLKCRDLHSIVAKILSLGMAEHSSTLCIMTNYRIIYRSVASNCRGKRRQWEASIPISAVRSVFWSNFYHKSNKIMAIASQIPCVNKCTCFCRCCPFLEDKSPHFWMGVPGATLRLILGNQRTYGAVMNGRLIWYCGTEDALTKTIVSLNNVQYIMGAGANTFGGDVGAPVTDQALAAENAADAGGEAGPGGVTIEVTNVEAPSVGSMLGM
jgi:hypothetical protein